MARIADSVGLRPRTWANPHRFATADGDLPDDDSIEDDDEDQDDEDEGEEDD